jgi:hypothetical protein
LKHLQVWGWLAVLVLVGFAIFSAAVESAMHFDSFAMDGPFQLFNALRRISVGQRVGDTFQFFHGPGIPYFFYPGFVLGGKTFVAAEVSRQMINVGLFLASLLIVCRALAGDWKNALPIAVIALIVMVEFRLDALIYPLNSLLGARSTMPLVVAAHLLMRPSSRRADVERGLLLGAALLLGTEQGMAAIAALLVTRTVVAIAQATWRAELCHFLVEASVASLSFLVVIVALAGSHTLSVLRFNFQEVPQDQLWYFGAPPNAFLSRWDEIPPMLAQRPRWWITIAAAMAVVVFSVLRGAKTVDRRRTATGLFLVLYALISLTSMLGIFIPAYAQPATRASLFVVIAWAYFTWREQSPRLPKGFDHIRAALPAIGALVLVLLSFAREPGAMVSLARAPIHVVRDHIFGAQRPQMSEAWVESQITGLAEVEKVRRSLGRTPKIWSTYAGLLEWQIGVFHPATDYIIHTLGAVRRSEYAREFVAERPDLVQTIRPGYIWYEEWLEGAHWDFYRALLDRYDVSARGPWSFFWTPTSDSAPPPGQPLVDMKVPSGAGTISADPHLPADSVGLYEVRIRYHVRNRLGAIPVFGGMPRYLIDMVGSADQYPISLAPYATERAFPVVIRGGQPIIVRSRVASLLGGASVTLDSVRIQRIPISRANTLWMNDYVTRHYLAR